MYDQRFGQPEGLTERLQAWIERLSTDKHMPWVGLGIVKDLECAIVALGGESPKPDPRQKNLEFDL